jgi:methionine biosynthesis protein MetW
VLDVGCSNGGFLSYLTSVRPNVKARGTDVARAALEAAAAKGHDVFYADLTTEPLDREYDYITCFEVIEHIHEAEAVLVNLRDATRRQLIMSLPNLGYIEHRIRLGIFGRFPNTSLVLHVKEHIRHWTVRDFKDWAAHFDLDVVSVEGQKGFPIVPWRRFPSLFAAQVVYTLEPRRSTSNAH